MIPSRPLLALAAAIALANAAGCSKSDSVAHPAPPPSFPSRLAAPLAPAPAPSAEVTTPERARAAQPEEKPTAAEVAAIEHPHVAK
jgi:hypothetical protein